MYEKSSTLPTEVFNLAIDSKYRDIRYYPDPNKYVINFDVVFKNVVSVELVFALYEKISTDYYINLCIEELTPNLHSNSNPVKGSFTQLPIIDSFNKYDQNMFKSIKMFDKPVAKFHKMTISFLNPDGGPYPIRDHFLRFEVTCLKSQAVTEWRNFEIISKSVNMFQASQEWNPLNPRSILDLPQSFTEDDLKKAFVKKAKMYKNNVPEKYSECKRAFKDLYSQIQ